MLASSPHSQRVEGVQWRHDTPWHMTLVKDRHTRALQENLVEHDEQLKGA
jgi:hypothetical protein